MLITAEVVKHSATSEVEYNPQDGLSKISNATYSFAYLNGNPEPSEYILQEIREISRYRGQEGQDSRITLSIFDLENGVLKRTISKLADDIDVTADFLQATKYGCCGAESSCELSEVWRDNTFLIYNAKYYLVDIPNTRREFYFGYLADARDEKQLIHGILCFAQSYKWFSSGKQGSFKEFKSVSHIVFKTKEESLYRKLVEFSPEITLLKNSERDQLIDYRDHQELRLWSFDKHDELEGIDFMAIRLIFQNDTTITVDIPIKNGLLFGDDTPERVIYLVE